VIGSAITHGVSSVSLYLIINGIVGIIISVFVAPFYAALVTVTYTDLRVRKEGVSSEVLLSGATPTGTPPGVAPLPGAAPSAGQPAATPPPPPPAADLPASQPPAPEPPASQPPAADLPASQPPASEPPPSSTA
jgi:hypothetical protein